MSKKICHISSAHKNADTRIFQLECVSLAANGYDVYLVIEGESKSDRGVHIIGLGPQPSSRVKRMTAYARKAYKTALALDCDVYHIHDPELLPYARKLKKTGKKVIFDSHENTLEQMEDKSWIPLFLRDFVARIYREYAKKVFSQMDCLVSVTPHIIGQLRTINPNSYMITNYPNLTDSINRVYKDVQSLEICFTGGIQKQWNQELIIRAISDLDGVIYNLCGWGREDYIDSLKNTSGWEKVHFYGGVTHSQSIEIQRQSDVGIAILTPSKNTGGMTGTIGNTKLFEYMMAGLPIVCTDFDLWRDIINKYHCGICVPVDNIEKLREAIIYLRDHRKEALEMGDNGRRAVEEEYNWSSQEKVLLGMYRDLLDL